MNKLNVDTQLIRPTSLIHYIPTVWVCVLTPVCAVQFGLFLKKKGGEKMAGGFARSIRDLEFEIDQFTNRIELVRNHFASFCQFVVVDLEKVVVFVCC